MQACLAVSGPNSIAMQFESVLLPRIVLLARAMARITLTTCTHAIAPSIGSDIFEGALLQPTACSGEVCCCHACCWWRNPVPRPEESTVILHCWREVISRLVWSEFSCKYRTASHELCYQQTQLLSSSFSCADTIAADGDARLLLPGDQRYDVGHVLLHTCWVFILMSRTA